MYPWLSAATGAGLSLAIVAPVGWIMGGSVLSSAVAYAVPVVIGGGVGQLLRKLQLRRQRQEVERAEGLTDEQWRAGELVLRRGAGPASAAEHEAALHLAAAHRRELGSVLVER